jgi:uncharacterized protein YbaR (Trm112 family)
MDSDATERVAELAAFAEADVLKGLVCPECAGSLDVQFTKSRGGKGAGSISVTCAKCEWRVIADGIPAEPPWAREQGSKVQTRIAGEKGFGSP